MRVRRRSTSSSARGRREELGYAEVAGFRGSEEVILAVYIGVEVCICEVGACSTCQRRDQLIRGRTNEGPRRVQFQRRNEPTKDVRRSTVRCYDESRKMIRYRWMIW